MGFLRLHYSQIRDEKQPLWGGEMDVKCFSFALDGDDAGLLLGGEESVQRGEIGEGLAVQGEQRVACLDAGTVGAALVDDRQHIKPEQEVLTYDTLNR